MRRFLRFLRRILLAPVRLVTWPFRKLKGILDHEPADSPAGETLARALQQPSILLEHLEAMRGHLLRSIAALAVTITASFFFAADILDWLAQPVGGLAALQAIEVTESLGAFMRVSILTGLVIALPYLGLEAFAFVHPGLRRRERIILLTLVPMASLLFVLGLAFAKGVMLPAALPFLLDFMGITTVPRPANYISFVTGLMFWIGVTFQFPLVIYALAAIGVVRARDLVEGWRLAVVAIAILAAAVTPTVDPVNMALVMAPMLVLYFISIGLAKIAERGRARREKAASA